MSYKKYLRPKNILTFSALNYIQAGISFLVAFFLARELGKTQYGFYTHGLIFANTLAVLIQFGQDKTLVRDLIQLEKPAPVLWAASIIKLSLALIGLVLITIWVLGFTDLSNYRIAIVIICSLSGMVFGMSPKAWFDFQGKINFQAIILLCDRLLFSIGALCIIFFFSEERVVISICCLLFFSRSMASVIEWNYVRKTAPFNFTLIKPFIKTVLSDNVFVWIAAIGNLMMTQVNQLILEGKTEAGELGLYGFALQMIMLVRLIQTQITRLATPSIANIIKNGRRKIIFTSLIKYSFLSLIITMFLVVPLYFCAPWLIKNFVRDEFLNSIPILNVLLIWISVYGIAMINNQFLLSFRLQKHFMVTTIVFGIIAVFLSNYLVGIYQGVGAAMALLIAHSGSILTQQFFVLRKISKL